MAQYSAPALIARMLKLSFIAPQYPMPVITDMERALMSPADLLLALPRMKENLSAWLAGATYDGDTMFDDIAIAGARAEDLRQLNWNVANANIQSLQAQLTPGESIVNMPVFPLFFYINAAFLLDPSKHSGISQALDLADLAPLAQVAVRQPKRLIINIGANHGYWTLAFEATDVITDGIAATADFKSFPDEMRI